MFALGANRDLEARGRRAFHSALLDMRGRHRRNTLDKQGTGLAGRAADTRNRVKRPIQALTDVSRSDRDPRQNHRSERRLQFFDKSDDA